MVGWQFGTQMHSTSLQIMLSNRFALVEKRKPDFYSVDSVSEFLGILEF